MLMIVCAVITKKNNNNKKTHKTIEYASVQLFYAFLKKQAGINKQAGVFI